MAVDHRIIRNTENFKGLDKRSSDILRTREYASDIKNAAYRLSGAINKRKGFKHRADIDEACFGAVNFKKLVTATGSVSDETIVAKENNLVRIVSTNISIRYTQIGGSAETYAVSSLLDSDTKTYVFKIFQNGVETFSLDLGTGKEASPVTMSDLKLALPTNWSLSYSYQANIDLLPAAFMENIPRTALTLTGGTYAYVNTNYQLEQDVDKGDTSVTDIFTHTHDGSHQNVSFEQMHNVLYISNGKDNVMKYDGSKVYRAGLPIFPEDSDAADYFDEANNLSSDSTGTALTNGYYSYKLVLEYTDAVGNVITSQPSNAALINVTGGSNHVHIDFSDYVGTHIEGFDKAGTFDSSHPLFDSLEVGVRPNTATIDKYQNEKRLRVLIYRSYDSSPVAADAIYHLVADVPYDYDVNGYSGISSASVFSDEDTDTDINLFLALTPTIKRKDPPPKGAYLAKFKDCLVISGQTKNVNNIQYSQGFDADSGEIGSEYFPNDTNGVIVNSSFGNKITAIAPLRDLLYIFHEDSIHVLAGDISDPEGIPFTVDLLTNEGGLGCVSHQSITEFQNNLIFLSRQGYYSINSSNALTEMSSLVKPLFNDKSLVFERALTFNWTDKDLLIMMVPKEAPGIAIPGRLFTSSDSLIIVYDYYRGAWLKWDSLDFSAGMCVSNNKLLFISRKESDHKLNSFNDLGDTTDYADHTEAINFEYDTNWESLNEPTIPKKFLRLRLHSFDTEENFESPSFDVDVKIQKDYNDVDLGSINFNFGGGSLEEGWGLSPWGSSAWGNIQRKFVKSKLPTGKSKCLKLRFINNTINQNVLITNYELEIATPYRTEIKD